MSKKTMRDYVIIDTNVMSIVTSILTLDNYKIKNNISYLLIINKVIY